MTSSPELIHELRASRPSAPAELRARVRVIAAERPARARWASWRFPVRRGMLIAVPAAAALAFASAGVLGLARSDVAPQANRQEALDKATAESAPLAGSGRLAPAPGPTQGSTLDQSTDRAQRVSATLTVEVSDPDAVSRAAQDALDLTRSLGGYVVSSSVATGEEGSASLTVRVPVTKVQDAITGLSGSAGSSPSRSRSTTCKGRSTSSRSVRRRSAARLRGSAPGSTPRRSTRRPRPSSAPGCRRFAAS